MDDLGDVLLKDAGALVKGEDVACGSGQCYTVSTTLSPTSSGERPGAGAVAGLPVDLTGATVKVTRGRREEPAVPPRGGDGRPHDA